MFHTILFIIYILMILTVIFIERKSHTETLLWVFIMICLPYAGTILYLVFGSGAIWWVFFWGGVGGGGRGGVGGGGGCKRKNMFVERGGGDSGSGRRENQAYDPGSEGKLFSGSCYKLFLRTASGIWI